MIRKAAMLGALVGLVGCASPNEGPDMSRQGFLMRPGYGMNSCAACAGSPSNYQQAPAAAMPSTAMPVRPTLSPQYLPPPSTAAPVNPAAPGNPSPRPADNRLTAAAPAVPPAPGCAGAGGEIALTSGTQPAPADASAPQVQVAPINSRRIALNYEVKDGGQGGDPRIELWYTHDGKPWELYQAPPSRQPPYIVEVKEEGRYGFALVARNAAGAGQPPQANDPPQVQVEVDLTSPVVQLLGVQPDPNPENHSVTVLWRASDKNLGPQPIALSWARETAGPWFPITSQLENTGCYVWRLPAGLPPQVWLRVEAADLAGNTAMVQTSEAITVDRSATKGSVVTINSLQKVTPALPPPFMGRVTVVGVEAVQEPPPPVRAGISAVDFSDK